MTGPYRSPPALTRCTHAWRVVMTHATFEVWLHVACARCGALHPRDLREAWILLLWRLGVGR